MGGSAVDSNVDTVVDGASPMKDGKPKKKSKKAEKKGKSSKRRKGEGKGEGALSGEGGGTDAVGTGDNCDQNRKKDKKRKISETQTEIGSNDAQSKKKKHRKDKKKGKKKEERGEPRKRSRDVPFPHKYILAPMVGASELAFRLLCRKYGAELAYTPMMSSQKFASDPDYRRDEFQTVLEDRPLVCHFSANNPEEFAAAARLVEGSCDAVDLNLGCPQRTAHVGHFGSYLLEPEDRNLICDIVRTAVQTVKIPIFVKIRLLNTLEETIELCRQLRDAGASLIAIHARYRASWERKGAGARDGPALLDQVAEIKKAVTEISIIANGNVIIYNDVVKNLELTGADGIMSAEGILDNPALFLPRLSHNSNNIEECAESNAFDKQPLQDAAPKDYGKEKRKILKKLRNIAKIEEKIKDCNGDENLNKDERAVLEAKDDFQEKLRQLELEAPKDLGIQGTEVRYKCRCLMFGQGM